jgi:glycosyltransferase involved in cell wall biosynthesis
MTCTDTTTPEVKRGSSPGPTDHPVRVQMLSFEFHPRGGGTARQALTLSRALADDGLEVRVATARFRGYARRSKVDGIPLDRLMWAPDRRGLRRLAKVPYLTSLSSYLFRRRHLYDVVHCHMASFEVIPAVLISQRAGVPVLVKIAGSGPEGDIARLRAGDEPWGVLGPPTARLLGHVRAIVAPSRRIERELREQGYTNGLYIPNGVDVQAFRPASDSERLEARHRLGLSPDGMAIGFLGRLHRDKGVDILIRAWAASALARTGAILCLAGNGPEEASLRRIANEVGASHTIRFVGVVDSREFLHAIDASVLPSRTEGMPNALLEAMACGLACVGTRVAGTEDVIEPSQTGWLVPAGDTAALAVALDQLPNDSLRARLGQAARSRVAADFALPIVAARYRDLYCRLIGQAPSLARVG